MEQWLLNWISKPAKWYQFWLPQSGAIGGTILALVLMCVLSLFIFISLARAEVTYTKDIQPLFKTRCSLCHDTMGDKNWQVYQNAYRERDKIKERVVIKKDMPLGNATGMTDSERQLVGNWVDEGSKK